MQEVQDRRVGAGPHQRAWCKHAQPDQRNGSGKDQRQGPAEDAASGCDSRSWSGLDEDAARCSQRCIAMPRSSASQFEEFSINSFKEKNGLDLKNQYLILIL